MSKLAELSNQDIVCLSLRFAKSNVDDLADTMWPDGYKDIDSDDLYHTIDMILEHFNSGKKIIVNIDSSHPYLEEDYDDPAADALANNEVMNNPTGWWNHEEGEINE